MILRKYKSEDCPIIAKLFYDTVHNINIKDYTKEQVDVWAKKDIALETLNLSLLQHFTIVALFNGIIVGFGDITKKGYLDRLYVHKDYQRKGIGTLICDKLEQIIEVNKITTHSSITAKPFFEHRGYKIVKSQQVERDGILLSNYIMEKENQG
ncbi:MAG: GNAT family N-acetyltransferase [Lachnospirales bacterium]